MAVDYKIPILTVRIDNKPFSLAMKYLLSTSHWFCAYEKPLEEYFQPLLLNIQKSLDKTFSLNEKFEDLILEAKNRLSHRSEVTIHRLQDQKRFRPEIFVERMEMNVVVDSFLAGKELLLVVNGPPGSGKTSWLCDLTRRMLSRNGIILFESYDRLMNRSFLEFFQESLQLYSQTTCIIDQLALAHDAKHICMIVDDLSLNGHEEDVLLSLFQWLEQMTHTSTLKVIVTLRTDRWNKFASRHIDSIPSNLVRSIQIPPLEYGELVELVDKLSLTVEKQDTEVEDIRKRFVAKLSRNYDASARRPGFVVTILESFKNENMPIHFSPYQIYTQLYQRQVLEMESDGIVKKPIRGRMLKKIAKAMIETSEYIMAIEDTSISGAGLVDTQTGDRSADYTALIASNILVEVLEECELKVAFQDMRFFEFVGALSYSLEDVAGGLMDLISRSSSFPPALTISAFLVGRHWHAKNNHLSYDLLQALDAYQRTDIINELASIDPSCFLNLYRTEVEQDSDKALAQLERILNAGEPRLSLEAVKVFLEKMPAETSHVAEAQYIKARAYYEIDDYLGAEQALQCRNTVNETKRMLLQASIAAAREKFDEAKKLYESLIDRAVEMHDIDLAQSYGGLGYVLSQKNMLQAATESLQRAIALLESKGDSKYLAESLGDLGQVFGKMGRFKESRRYLEESLNINKRLGFLVGIGVAEGMIGELDILEYNFSDAESRLDRSLVISRRVGNRWREAWVLQKISELKNALGLPVEADDLKKEAQRLFGHIH